MIQQPLKLNNMKQIFVGSTQRSKLYVKINKTLLPTKLVMVGIFALLVLIPFCFSDLST